MSKKKKYSLTKVGELNDGTRLVSGLFPLYDSLGMPLEDIVLTLKAEKIEICWIHFYQEALQAGWQHKTVMNKLYECFFEVYSR